MCEMLKKPLRGQTQLAPQEDADAMRAKCQNANAVYEITSSGFLPVTEDGKQRHLHIATFAREEDAARAYDRVSIAKLGHAKAKTNFPVAEYREEWAELEALGVDGAVALMREHAAAERQDVMNKASRFRGVYKDKSAKAKPWVAQISVTESPASAAPS